MSVDGEEGLGPLRAGLVQDAGDLLLSQPAFADQQDRMRLRRMNSDELLQVGDIRTDANKTFVILIRDLSMDVNQSQSWSRLRPWERRCPCMLGLGTRRQGCLRSQAGLRGALKLD